MVGNYALPPVFYPFIQTPFRILWEGQSAVKFFFVLSGFVLAVPFLRTDRGVNIAGVVTQRVFRIYPAFLVALVLGLAGKWAAAFQGGDPGLAQAGWFQPDWTEMHSLSRIAGQVALVIPDGSERVLPQDWTLRWEMLASVFVPGLALLCRRRSFIPAALAGLHWAVGLAPAILCFALGILLASQETAWKLAWSRWSGLRKGAFTVGALFLATTQTSLNPEQAYYVRRFLREPEIVGVAALLLVALGSQRAQQFLLRGPLQFLGRVSYGVYLVHITVQLALLPVALSVIAPLCPSPTGLWILGFLLSVTVSIPLGWALHKWVETPANGFGRKLAARITATTPRLTIGRGFGRVPTPLPHDESSGPAREAGPVPATTGLACIDNPLARKRGCWMARPNLSTTNARSRFHGAPH